MEDNPRDSYHLDIDASKALEALTHREAPAVLYHYTTRAPLIAILETRQVFASSIRHLNDAQEFEYATSIARKVLSDALKPDGDERWLHEQIGRLLEGVKEQARVFVFSLSEHGDQLSQWRAYCKPMDGYAVGFTTKALVTAAAPAYHLVPVHYDPTTQRDLIDKLRLDAEVSFRANLGQG